MTTFVGIRLKTQQNGSAGVDRVALLPLQLCCEGSPRYLKHPNAVIARSEATWRSQP